MVRKSLLQLLSILFLSSFLAACGGSGGGSTRIEPDPVPDPDPEPEDVIVDVGGGGVKGPLANADVTVYELDLAAADLKGSQFATATTDSAAQITGLSLTNPEPPYLLEFTSVDGTTTDLTTGAFPVIPTVRTIITQEMLDGDENLYATPLTTMAVDLAISNADDAAPYGGDGDGSITEDEFLAALPVAATQVKSTVGFGLDDTIDIFNTPPLIDDSTDSAEDQEEVAAYRSAVEALTAVVAEMQELSGGDSDSQDVLSEMTRDLSDGAIDGVIDDVVSEVYVAAALDVLDQDPAQLTIPGTQLTVGDVTQVLIDETAETGSDVDTTTLETTVVVLALAERDPDLDDDGVANSDDAFPEDETESEDTDGDNIGDNADTDDDNDGVGDDDDAFPKDAGETTDTDADGTGNNADDDDDGDGVDDADDDFPLDENASDATDADEDGWPAEQDADDADADNPGVDFVDTDGDGIGDGTDDDDDGDGVPDEDDEFPTNPDETADADNDGTGDNEDTDRDGDGVENEEDDFPNNPAETSDLDHDGIGDNSDDDIDGDGLSNDEEEALGTDPADRDSDDDGFLDGGDAFPLDDSEALDTDEDGTGNNDDDFPLDGTETTDTDDDGTGDNADTDDDDDGTNDDDDAFPLDETEDTDTDNDGTGNNADTDDDDDGTDDVNDDLPLDPTETVDTDSDGIGNNADTDDDGDDVNDEDDDFPLDATETTDTDEDGIGNNADTDDDDDGTDDVNDDLPLDPTETTDTDSDGVGNNADPDDDGDDVNDEDDDFPLDGTETVDTDEDGTGDNADTDDDGDGTNDDADDFPLDATEDTDTDSDGVGNNADDDDDGDLVNDEDDDFPLDGTETVDTDDDGTGDNADTDDDGDGTNDDADDFPLDETEDTDTDSDGVGNNADPDDDGDGTDDIDDDLPLDATETTDTDGDGTGNNADTDDDGDGTDDVDDDFPLDETEDTDTDSDGVGNNADPDDDGDGTDDVDDDLPLDETETTDTDGDGTGNNADTDDDGDGTDDVDDDFPLDEMEDTDTDSDGVGNNADPDDDDDGVDDVDDDFPLDETEDTDTDDDGIGDNADDDDDGDGIDDDVDLCPVDPDPACENEQLGDISGFWLSVATVTDALVDPSDAPVEDDPTCALEVADLRSALMLIEQDGDGIEGEFLAWEVPFDGSIELNGDVVFESVSDLWLDNGILRTFYQRIDGSLDKQGTNSTADDVITGTVDQTVEYWNGESLLISCDLDLTVNMTRPAKDSDLTTLFTEGGGGLTWFEVDEFDDQVEYEFGVVSEDPELFFGWDGDTWTPITDTGFEYFISEEGILSAPDNFVISDYLLDNDGVVISLLDDVAPFDPLIQAEVRLTYVDVEGLVISDFLPFEFRSGLGENAKFSTGARAYVGMVNEGSELYDFWCDDDWDESLAGLECANIVPIGQEEDGVGTGDYDPIPAESLDDIIFDSTEIMDLTVAFEGGLWVGQNGSVTYNALLTNAAGNDDSCDGQCGSVIFVSWDWNVVDDGGNAIVTAIGETSFSNGMVGAFPIVEFTIPEDIADLADRDDDEVMVFYFEAFDTGFNGTLVRSGNQPLGYTDVEIFLNATARADLEAAFAPSAGFEYSEVFNTAATNGVDFANSGWELQDYLGIVGQGLLREWEEGEGEDYREYEAYYTFDPEGSGGRYVLNSWDGDDNPVDNFSDDFTWSIDGGGAIDIETDTGVIHRIALVSLDDLFRPVIYVAMDGEEDLENTWSAWMIEEDEVAGFLDTPVTTLTSNDLIGTTFHLACCVGEVIQFLDDGVFNEYEDGEGPFVASWSFNSDTDRLTIVFGPNDQDTIAIEDWMVPDVFDRDEDQDVQELITVIAGWYQLDGETGLGNFFRDWLYVPDPE